MEEPGIRKVTDRQIELLGNIHEQTARQFISSKVPPTTVENLSIGIETKGEPSESVLRNLK